MHDGDRSFKKKIIFMSKIFHNATCHILIDGQQWMMSTWYQGCNYNGVA
jgi:hypothetical protein